MLPGDLLLHSRFPRPRLALDAYLRCEAPEAITSNPAYQMDSVSRSFSENRLDSLTSGIRDKTNVAEIWNVETLSSPVF